MRRLIIFIVLILSISLPLAGCSRGSASEQVKFGIRGEIKKVTIDDTKKTTTILVEGNIQNDTEYDKAYISITKDTKILRGELKLLPEDLESGMMVEVIITGPVRESYPVQADAKEIRVIKQP
jgi:beta-N-acetylhexosaminidase